MISFVLPAYNEEASLPPLLGKIAETMSGSGRPYRVVAVNDGSRDRTPEVLADFATRMPVEVVTHKTNLGLPQTILDGLRYASEGRDPKDIVITMDADNTHEPRYALDLIRRVEEGCDVVVASRYQPGAAEVGLAPHRKVLSKGVNVMLALFLPIKGVRDYTCGYRAYRAGLLQRTFAAYGDQLIESTTFSAMAEILLKAGFLGVAAGEVPLVLRYDQKAGASKMKVVRTILDYLRMIASLRWRQATKSRSRR